MNCIYLTHCCKKTFFSLGRHVTGRTSNADTLRGECKYLTVMFDQSIPCTILAPPTSWWKFFKLAETGPDVPEWKFSPVLIPVRANYSLSTLSRLPKFRFLQVKIYHGGCLPGRAGLGVAGNGAGFGPRFGVTVGRVHLHPLILITRCFRFRLA